MHYQCLIIDDEIPLAESTMEYFNLFDVHTAAVFDSSSCISFLEENTVDLILLDINLPASSGFALCRKLRETQTIPILFISARQSDDDILLAYHMGGDDYIRKPYSLNLLLAKVKAILKRSIPHGNTENIYECGPFTIDCSAERVLLCSTPLKLKAMEYKLLCYFIHNRGRVLSKEELFQNVWEDSITGDGTLNVHIRHLREKIEENPNSPKFIKTVWGTGYLFEDLI